MTGRPERLARGLGWFSIALGVPQLLAPGRVNRLVGVPDSGRSRLVMRAVGVRELAGAGGILDRPRPGGFLFARVAGDAMDLALLAAAFRAKGSVRTRVVSAAAAVAGVTALDVLAAARTSRTSGAGVISARTSATVNRPPEDVYRAWRDFEQLPRYMSHLESVQVNDDRLSHWVAKGPAGTRVEWDAEVVDDVPNQLIAWRSLENADVPNSGSVRFVEAPGDRGTEVTLQIRYEPPAGAVGAAVARLFGEDPLQQAKDDLRRFKQVVETGEVMRSDGTPEGTRTHRQLFQREAQPA